MVDTRRMSLYTLFALTWALLAVAMLSGCVAQSIHPFYDQRTAVFDDALLGAWGDGEAEWRFAADHSGGYRMLHTDEDASIPATAHLARIDGRLYLDIFVEDLPEGADELYETVFLPLHTLLRVDELGDTLRTSSLEWRWLKEYLQANPGEVAHAIADGRVVLTDDTAALQAFIAQHAADAGAWEEAVVMQRRPTDSR